MPTEEYRQGWKRAKEKTSAGPSTLHFGHCKAGALDPRIVEFEAAMASIPMKSGYAYKRWRKGTDVELLKKANSFHVSKLRTIVLFEADFNFTNKAVGRKVGARAEAHQGMAKEQGGSRKNHRAVEIGLNKCLTMDQLRQLKWPGILCSNDMKSCYDRIVHAVASLCLQRQGISESEVVCMFSTLQNLEHTIRTAYGDSEETYGGDLWVIPMQGVYQGNGAGPLIWAVVSSPLLDIMREEGFGTFFKTSISSQDIRFVGYAFVDDTDLIQTSKDGTETGDEMREQMQAGVNTWEGIIDATGGALAVEKSRWWLIDFIWDEKGNYRYATIEDTPGQLTVKDWDGIVKPIQRMEPTEAYETLGLWMAPDGNLDEQFDRLLTMVKRWSDRIRTSYLRKHDAAYALKVTVLKKIEYALPALNLSKAQCDKLMSPILQAALPKAGYNRNFPKEVIHGPNGLLGAGIHHPYTTQLITHIDMLLRHGGRDTITGQLLTGNIETTKLEIGLPGPLFGQDFKQFGQLTTDCWVKGVWQEIHTIGTDIQVDEHTASLQLKTQYDRFLIEGFAVAGYKNKQLRTLNKCRISCRAVTLADISTGDGRRLLPGVFEGVNPMAFASPYTWPNQGGLPPEAWRLWKVALKKAFQIRNDGSLATPLGRWLIKEGSDTWPSWYDPLTAYIYIREGNQFRRFRIAPGFALGFRNYNNHGMVASLPEICWPATAWINEQEQLENAGWARYMVIPDDTLPTDIEEVRGQLPAEAQWAVEWLEQIGGLDHLAAGIQTGTTIAIADGSFKDLRGTSGFALIHGDSQQRINGANQVPGEASDQASYRSELAGIYGALLLAQMVCKLFDIGTGHMIVACDNESAGQKAIDWHYPPKPSNDHFDMLNAIHQLRHLLPITMEFRHVEAHQREKYGSQGALDNWAIWNDEMDSLAKAYWLFTREAPACSSKPVYGKEWAVWVNGRKVCKKFSETIRDAIHTDSLTKWWLKESRTKRAKFTQMQIELMDTVAAKAAWDIAKTARRKWICKHAADLLPVGRNMKRWQFWQHHKCPRCLADDENGAHVLRCQDQRACTQRAKLLDAFDTRLRTIKTGKDIRRTILAHVREWMNGNGPARRPIPQHLRDAVHEQTTLGWDQFMKGRIATSWVPLQSTEFVGRQLRNTGKSWAAALIVAIWDLSWQMWDHRNDILHNSDVYDHLIDMDATDFSIIEEWHAGSDDLPALDQLHFRGISLDELLAKSSRYRREWLLQVATARAALWHNDTDDSDDGREPETYIP